MGPRNFPSNHECNRGSTNPIDTDRPNTHCQNCGEVLSGRFCAACGQKDLGTRVDLRELVGEFVSETFELEGRLPRTLGSVVFLPGWYLYQYLDGKRRRYSSPIRFYLLAVFLCVLALGWRVDRAAKAATDSSQLYIVSDDEGGMEVIFGDGKDAIELRAELDRAHADRLWTVTEQEVFPQICPEDLSPLPWNPTCEDWAFDWIGSMAQHPSEFCYLDDGVEDRMGIALLRLLHDKPGNEALSTLVAAALEQMPIAMSVMIGVFALLLKLAWWREPTTVHVLTSVVFHALVLYALTLVMLWPSGWVVWVVYGWLQAHALFSLRAAYPSAWPRLLASWLVLFVAWVFLAFWAVVLSLVLGVYRLSTLL